MARVLLACLALAALAALAALPLAGCGDGGGATASTGSAMGPAGSDRAGSAPPRDEARPAARASRRRGRTIRIVDSQFGTVIADRAGEALYLFDKEETRRAECYGACAEAWPPVLTKGRPVAGKGVRRRWLGTTRRRSGRLQVTYRGHPLYYYVHDAPGRILCHDVLEFGGLWLVVAPDGTPRA